MRVLVRGAGVTGLTVAFALVRRGVEVAVRENAQFVGQGASRVAAGMLAPWCEQESGDRRIVGPGRFSIEWWSEIVPDIVNRNGTLVVAHGRDIGELDRFAARTKGFRHIGEQKVAELEPALAGRFRAALYFPEEAHLDGRAGLAGLHDRLVAMGARFHFGGDAVRDADFGLVVDCTGPACIGMISTLRGVRGETVELRTNEVKLSRPVRLLHPRIPLYLVPMPDDRFILGATMIESECGGPPRVRSVLELLGAAVSLHPAFGEAEILDIGVGVRPAFPDNFPRIGGSDKRLWVNGMFRHGFLLAPFLAEQVAARILETAAPEIPA